MVDGTSSLAFAYNQSLSLQAQLTPSGTSVSYQKQTQAALVEQSANGDVFGAAVEIDLSVTAQTGAAQTGAAPATATAAGNSAGQQALNTVENSNAQARAFPKHLAAQKLDQAVKELTILKLLGSGPAAAKEAAKIAKEIGDAVKDYTGAQQAQFQAGDIASVPDPSTDPFLQVATAALGEVGKFLKKTLPALENSSDPKARDAARKARHEFDKATTELQNAETGGVPPTGTGESDTAAAGTADDSTVTITATETATAVEVATAA